jgi:serine protease Do
MKSWKAHVPDLIRTTVLPVVLGLLAGVAGSLASEAYLKPPLEPSPSPIGQPVRSLPSPLPEAEIAARLRRLDLPVYLRRNLRGGDLIDRAHVAGEAVGQATVLTSDGWLVTHHSVAVGPLSVGVDGRVVEVDRQMVDVRTGLVFLKIQASALPVTGFEETSGLRLGAPLYAEDELRLTIPTLYGGAGPAERRPPGIGSSDRFSRVFRLDRTFGPKAAGGAVLTREGSLAGILVPAKDGPAAFVPSHLFRPVVAEVFRGQQPTRALLGVQYLDLESAYFAGEPAEAASGALLAPSRRERLPAVRPGSAAARAGLRQGDIIARFDGVEISGGRDLSELVGEYEKGAKVKIEILRAGVRRPLDVTLD